MWQIVGYRKDGSPIVEYVPPLPFEWMKKPVCDWWLLQPHERREFIRLGTARHFAHDEWRRERESGYYSNHLIIPDPDFSGKVVDPNLPAHAHIYGLSGQYPATMAFGVPLIADASGKGDRCDQGTKMEWKASSYTGPEEMEMKIPTKDIDGKPGTEWFNQIYLDEAFKWAKFVGCINRELFLKLMQPKCYDRTRDLRDNMIVPISQLLPGIAVQRGGKVEIYPIQPIVLPDGRRYMTSNDTGFGLNLVKT